jgi:hypothetical protein
MYQLTVRGQVQKSEQCVVKMTDQIADGWSFCLMGGQDDRSDS